MGGYLDNVSMDVLQKGLDAVWLRQQVISNNIANDDTPGYKSKSVQFEDLLQNVMDGSHGNAKTLKKAVDHIEPVVKETANAISNVNGNNVDLDAENIELARAQIQYDYLVSSLTSQISRLKYAINGGNY